jgi:hypothetical protein
MANGKVGRSLSGVERQLQVADLGWWMRLTPVMLRSPTAVNVRAHAPAPLFWALSTMQRLNPTGPDPATTFNPQPLNTRALPPDAAPWVVDAKGTHRRSCPSGAAATSGRQSRGCPDPVLPSSAMPNGDRFWVGVLA